MNKRISRRQFLSTAPPPLPPWRTAAEAGSRPAHAVRRQSRRRAPGCAGSTAARRRCARRDLGHAVAARQAARSRRISRCAARTAAPCRCRAGRSPTGRTARSSGPRMRCAPVRAPATGPSKSSRSAAPRSPPAAVTVKETRRRRRNRHRQFVCRLRAQRRERHRRSITRDGREALRDGKLVLLRQDRAAAHRRRAGHAGEFRERRSRK